MTKNKNLELNLDTLNKEQKRAIAFREGPLLLVAGAGTGKTTVIVYRLAYLIQQGKAKPQEILAVTFTEKAAQEMEERIDKLLPFGYVDLWVSTIHSFCKKVLEENALDIGLSTDFKLLDETASWLLIRQNLEKFKLDYYKPLGNPTKFIHALISHFSRCKDQAIYPEDYLKYAKKQKGEEGKRIKEINQAYKTYQDLLLGNNLLDFGDLINYCLKIFQKRPQILKQYRQKFKYILVDEFQDTNWVQYELVKLLAAPKNNLTVSADDDQAIYRFRGASFGNIVQFKKDFPKAKQIILTKNYRSTQDILDLSHNFVQQNNPNRLEYLDKIDKNLSAAEKGKGEIEHLHFKTADQQVRGIIGKILQILKTDKDAGFSDFAILVRANKSANSFSRALERVGLPYQFMALRGLYGKSVILDIISYFKLLDNYHESTAAFRVLNLPPFEIPIVDVAEISRYSNKKSQSIYQSLKESSLIPNLSKNTIKKIELLLNMIKKHSDKAVQRSTSELYIAFLQDSGYLEYFAKREDKENLGHISQFHDRIKAFEESNLDTHLRNFMQELDLEIESGEQGKLTFDIEQGPDMIRIMTVHAAKGLEFKYVFLVDLVDKKFPSIEKSEPIEIPKDLIKDIIPKGDVHLEEERRLFYVGMTRAKRGLYFASAEDFGGQRKKKLSRFLKELGYLQEEKGKLKEIDARGMQFIEKVKLRKKIKATEKFLPSHFSFTQLRAFENCPLQYEFAHIFKIPIRGRASFSYGKALHNTLFEFVKRAIKEKLNFKDLLSIYKKEWVDEWYDSGEQKKEYFEAGKKSLKVFYNDFLKKCPEIFLINGKPALEQDFNIKIGGHTLIGKIDRIDMAGGGVEIIDYKTGKAREKLDTGNKDQLLIYQIAAQEVFEQNPEKLTYYYIDGNKRVSFLGTKEDIEKEKKKIVSQIEEIKKADFSPTPGWQCKSCDFKNICEYAQE